jgi:Icc-related predicted phosphoesterase
VANRIVILGDVHAHEERLEATLRLAPAPGADLVLLAGDVGVDPPWLPPARFEQRAPHDESVQRVLRRVGQAWGGALAFVPGNHDLADPAEGLRAVNLDGRCAEVGGLSVAGLGGSGPQRHGFPYEWSEDEAAARLKRLFADGPAEIFLSHTPPADTRLDRTAWGEHVGSRAVRDGLARAQPRLFVCGHIHEAWGVEWLDDVCCLNAGALGEPYGQVLVWIVDWEKGPRRIRSICEGAVGQPRIRDWCRSDR